jgi:hypothetical protein
MGKLERQVLDLGNSIKTLNAPPAPPDSSSATPGGAAGVSAEELYQNALRDKSAGHLEMALQQFAEYLSCSAPPSRRQRPVSDRRDLLPERRLRAGGEGFRYLARKVPREQ